MISRPEDVLLDAIATRDARIAELERLRADTVWQFNEAVSLLREARSSLSDLYPLSAEIGDALPAIQSALKAAASEVSS